MSHLLFEPILTLNSSDVIDTIKSPKISRKIICIFRGSIRIILLVLKESSRILQIPKEEIVEKIRSILKKEIQIITTDNSIRNEVAKYDIQYGICHNPNSKILVAAKIFSWTHLSMNKKMFQTAEFKGILALNSIGKGVVTFEG